MRTSKEIAEGMKKKYAECLPEGVVFKPKGMILKEPKVNHEARMVSGIITTTDPDMENEVVVTSGLDYSYLDKFKTVYLGHDYEKPIGSMRRIKKVPDTRNPTGLWASTYITSTALGEDVLTMIDEDVMRGFSIGFASKAYGDPTEAEKDLHGDHSLIHREGFMFEYSGTCMPCNMGSEIDPRVVKSLDEMLTKGKIHRTTAVACGLDTTPERRFFATREVPIVAFDGTVMVPIRSRV